MKKLLLISILSLSMSTLSAQWIGDKSINNRFSDKMSMYDWDAETSSTGTTYIIMMRPEQVTEGGETYGTTTTRLQIIDADGVTKLPMEGKIISAFKTRSFSVFNDLLFVDKQGNAVIAVSDVRYDNVTDYFLSYTLYKVSPAGEMLWGDDGIDIENATPNYLEAVFNMIQLEDNSYIAAFEKSQGENQMGIEILHISQNGTMLWENPIILEGGGATYEYPYIVNAGYNQFIMVYAQNNQGYGIYAQKYDFDGSPVWATPATVYTGGFTIPNLQSILKVVPDNQGGVFVAWYDDRTNSKYEKAYVSYILSDGSQGFVTGGSQGQQILFGEGRRFIRPYIIFSNVDNALYAICNAYNSNQSVNTFTLQKISTSGELLWGTSGYELIYSDTIGYLSWYSIQPAEAGKLAVTYQYGALNDNPAYIVGHLLNTQGNMPTQLWGDAPLPISTFPGMKTSPTTLPLINNSFFLTLWEDYRESENSYEYFIAGQKIMLDGTVDVKTPFVDENSDFRAVNQNNGINFLYDLQNSGNVKITLYSIAGQQIAVVLDAYQSAGKQSTIFSTEGIGQGIYIAVLENQNVRKSAKVIVK
jgi:hypothetical protein